METFSMVCDRMTVCDYTPVHVEDPEVLAKCTLSVLLLSPACSQMHYFVAVLDLCILETRYQTS
jgi:hypothetical protein